MRFIGLRVLAAPALIVGLTTGCEVSFEVGAASDRGRLPAELAVATIETGMSDHGYPLEVTCEAPLTDDVGVRFMCQGVANDGQVANYSVLIDTPGTVLAAPLNLLAPESVEEIEGIILRRLSEDPDNAGVDLRAEHVQCGDGDGPIILDDNDQMMCVVTDPRRNEFLDVRITAVPKELGSTDFDIHLSVDGIRDEPIS